MLGDAWPHRLEQDPTRTAAAPPQKPVEYKGAVELGADQIWFQFEFQGRTLVMAVVEAGLKLVVAPRFQFDTTGVWEA